MYMETYNEQLNVDRANNYHSGDTWIQKAYKDKTMGKEVQVQHLKIAQKLVYFAVLFILIFILAMQIADCVRTYIMYPTYVETKIVSQPNAIFPAMTICPVKDGYNKTVLEVTRKCCIYI